MLTESSRASMHSNQSLVKIKYSSRFYYRPFHLPRRKNYILVRFLGPSWALITPVYYSHGDANYDRGSAFRPYDTEVGECVKSVYIYTRLRGVSSTSTDELLRLGRDTWSMVE